MQQSLHLHSSSLIVPNPVSFYLLNYFPPSTSPDLFKESAASKITNPFGSGTFSILLTAGSFKESKLLACHLHSLTLHCSYWDQQLCKPIKAKHSGTDRFYMTEWLFLSCSAQMELFIGSTKFYSSMKSISEPQMRSGNLRIIFLVLKGPWWRFIREVHISYPTAHSTGWFTHYFSHFWFWKQASSTSWSGTQHTTHL